MYKYNPFTGKLDNSPIVITTLANLATWAGRFDAKYKIIEEVTGVLPTISNTNAVVGNTLEIYNYNSPKFPLQGQENKVALQTGEFDPTKNHRLIVEYLESDKVNLIIWQNVPNFVAPTFGVNPSFVSTTAYEGESIAITPASGGTAAGSEYEWQGQNQDDSWSIIVGETSSSYTPARSADVNTGFKNVRCLVYPVDSQNRRGTAVTITISTFYKVENVNRVIANFETGTNIGVRSNGTKTSDGTSTQVTVVTADTEVWINCVVSPKFVLNETYRVFSSLKAREAGAATGSTVQIKPSGGSIFSSSPVSNTITVGETDFVSDVKTKFVATLFNPASSDGDNIEYAIQNVLVNDFINIENSEIYKVLNP